MNSSQRDGIFRQICQISDRQVDPQVKARLCALIGRTNEGIKDELLGLIDDIVFFAWTGDFESQVLQIVWRQIGGSDEELAARNAEIKNPDKADELQRRFKWAVSLQERRS